MHLSTDISHAHIHSTEGIQLPSIRCGSNVNAFAPEIQRTLTTGEVPGQTTIHDGVDQLSELHKHESTDMRKGESEVVHGIGYGQCLEVSRMMNFAWDT